MVLVKSKWTKELSGGYKKPRNPQFMLYLCQPSLDLEIRMTRTDGGVETGLIFFLSKNDDGERVALEDDVIFKSRYLRSSGVKEVDIGKHCHVGTQPGYYTITCCTQIDGMQGSFELEVKGNGVDSLKELPDNTRWIVKGKWGKDENAGHMSLINPQLPLIVKQKGKVFITLKKLSPSEKTGIIFFLLEWNNFQKKRKSYSELDVIEKTGYIRTDELSMTVTLDAGKYIVIPCSNNTPNGEFEVVVECFGEKVETLLPQIVEVSSNEKSLDCEEILKKFKCEDGIFYEKDPVPELNAYLSKNNARFRDSVFPPDDNSLYDSTGRRTNCLRRNIVHGWLRSSEIFDDPQVYVDGVDVQEVLQGSIGNCWLCQGISTVAINPKRITDILDPDVYNPHGVYSVRLYHNHHFCYVVIDDYFPVGKNNTPCFIRSRDDNELWVMILEKAFAKVYKSYEGLISDSPCEALLRLTGGRVSNVNLNSIPKQELWERMKKFGDKHWMMAATTTTNPDEETELVNHNGIVSNHAYSVLDVAEPTKDLKLLRIRNTWGRGEWTGPYSDDSPLWTPELKQKLHYEQKDDGIFWIPYDNFLEEFGTLTFCQTTCDDYPNSYRKSGAFTSVNSGYASTDNPRISFSVKETTNMLIRFSLNEKKATKRSMRVFVAQGKFNKSHLAKDEIKFASRYLTTDNLLLDLTIAPSDKQYHIFPSLDKQYQEKIPFKLLVQTNKEITFDEEYVDPYPFKFSLKQQKWTPCGGYLNKLNPMFLVTCKETSEVVIQLTRKDNQKVIGIRLILYPWMDQLPDHLQETKIVASSTFLLSNNVEFEHMLSPGKYIFLPCLQQRVDGALYDLNIKGSSKHLEVQRC